MRSFDKLRHHPRAPLKTLVKEKTGKKFPYFMSKNVSEGGMFLLSKNPYPKGSKVLLEFVVPGQGLSTTIEGEIVNQILYDPAKGQDEASCGMGVKFINTSDDLKAAIRSYVIKTRISHDHPRTSPHDGTDPSEAPDT